MKKQAISVNGVNIFIPEYYKKVDSMPGDPENSVPYEVQTENAGCIAFLSAVDYSRQLPREKDELISGIRHFLAENQGLIKVDVGKDYVYSIVKNLREPRGVQYILTYQRFCEDFILNVQAFFEEAGTTGIRDTMVYALCRNEGLLGDDDENPLAGWTQDPYDAEITKGALMNLSEQEQFDEQFPGFPLSVCREFINCVVEGE